MVYEKLVVIFRNDQAIAALCSEGNNKQNEPIAVGKNFSNNFF